MVVRPNRVAVRVVILMLIVVNGGCRPQRTDETSGSSVVIAERAGEIPPRPESSAVLSDLLNVAADHGPVESAVFRDVARESGIEFHRFNDQVPDRYLLPEVMGGGVAWLDFDCDGWFDLYATNGCELQNRDPGQTQYVNGLFRNRDGKKFDSVAVHAGVTDNRFGQGCAVGDMNADGFPDLYVTNFGRNSLLINNGDGTFSDTTESAGVGDTSWGTSAVWFDADRDGLNDLYVVNYVDLAIETHRTCTYNGVPGYCGPGQWNGVSDILYLSDGTGAFRKAGIPEQLRTDDAKGLAVAVCDFDADGVAEIYVANDMAPNFLLTQRPSEGNGADLTYVNVAESSGCAVGSDGRNEASMGIACADFDEDGRVDIFLTHYYQHKNTLYRNLGSLLFEDNSFRSRVAATSFDTLGFGTVAFDFDLDGDQDLFIANGHVLGPKHLPGAMRPQLLENTGSGIFRDPGEEAGRYFSGLYLSRGAAGGDFNNDGRVDIAVSHLDQPLALVQNRSVPEHHFIGIELMPRDRIFPAGGRLEIESPERRVIPLIAGGSYLSTGDGRVVAGLSEYNEPVTVTVFWNNGESDRFEGLLPDRYWRLRQSSADRVFHAVTAD